MPNSPRRSERGYLKAEVPVPAQKIAGQAQEALNYVQVTIPIPFTGQEEEGQEGSSSQIP